MQFIDLKAQQQHIRKNIDKAIAQVLDHGQYIMGQEVIQLEKHLSDFCGAEYVISCASGTDALLMPLLALNLQPTDAIFLPSFTFPASAEVIVLTGGTPVFVDVRQTDFNLCTDSLTRAIAHAKHQGLTPRAIMSVDMFGQPADYHTLRTIAKIHNLFLIADAATKFLVRVNKVRWLVP